MEEAEIGEVGVDHAADHAREKAHEEGHRAPWLRWLALSTAILAVLGAVASLISGKLANEALLKMQEASIHQAQASDAWAFYQARGVKGSISDSEAHILEAMGKSSEEAKKHSQHEKVEQDKLTEDAKKALEEQKQCFDTSEVALEHHHFFAYAVTILQVAIGLSAVAAIIENPLIWYFALSTGLIGTVMMIYGFVKGWIS